MTIKKYLFSVVVIASIFCSTSKTMSPAAYGQGEKQIWALLKSAVENKATLEDVQETENMLIKMEQAEAKKKIVNRNTQKLRRVLNEIKELFELNQNTNTSRATQTDTPQIPVTESAPSCANQPLPTNPQEAPKKPSHKTAAPSDQAMPATEPSSAAPLQKKDAQPAQPRPAEQPSEIQPAAAKQVQSIQLQKEREEKIRQESVIDFAAIDALIAKIRAGLLAVQSKLIASAIDHELLPSAVDQLNHIKPDMAQIKKILADPATTHALKSRRQQIINLENQFNEVARELA